MVGILPQHVEYATTHLFRCHKPIPLMFHDTFGFFTNTLQLVPIGHIGHIGQGQTSDYHRNTSHMRDRLFQRYCRHNACRQGQPEWSKDLQRITGLGNVD